MQTAVKYEPADTTDKVAVFHVPDEENLLEMPTAKAGKITSFPPSCPILLTTSTSDSLLVSRGTITSVFVDLSPGKASRDYYYKVCMKDGSSVIAGEHQLQWAPQSTVSIKMPQDTDGLDWKDAIIVGSYQEGPYAKIQYSVQEIATDALFHGVDADHLRYRKPSETEPMIKADPGRAAQKPSAVPECPSFESAPVVAADAAPVPFRQVSPNQSSSSIKKRPSEETHGEAIDDSAKKQKVVQDELSRDRELVTPLKDSETRLAQRPIGSGTKRVSIDHVQQTPSSASQAITSEMLLQLPPASQSVFAHHDPATDNSKVAHAPHEDSFGEKEEVRTSKITIPDFADRIRIREIFIGTAGRAHKQMLLTTGCHRINLSGHNAGPGELMEITFQVEASKMEKAQRIIEDAIVSSVTPDHKCRMLYYLSVENDYGASEGWARYQRLPDTGNWGWMSIVEVPHGFERCSGLFMDKQARAVRDIIRTSGCRMIHLSHTFPKHVYLFSEDEKMVNEATDLVRERVDWALSECERRRKVASMRNNGW